MGRFAIIQDGKVANIVEAEADFAEKQGWVEVGSSGIGGFQSGNPTIPSLSYYGGGGGVQSAGATQNTFDVAGSFSYYGGGGGASNNGARGGSVYGGRGGDASNAPEAPGGGAAYNASATNSTGARGEVRIWGII